MKNAMILFFILSFNVGNGTMQQEHTPDGECIRLVWQHVHTQKRLKILEYVKGMSGIVTNVSYLADGDAKILVKPDSAYKSLLNDVNIKQENSCLVVNVIFEANCRMGTICMIKGDYISRVFIPNIGNHVFVKGSYVLNKEFGYHAFHPVLSIKPL